VFLGGEYHARRRQSYYAKSEHHSKQVLAICGRNAREGLVLKVDTYKTVR